MKVCYNNLICDVVDAFEKNGRGFFTLMYVSETSKQITKPVAAEIIDCNGFVHVHGQDRKETITKTQQVIKKIVVPCCYCKEI